MTNFKEVDESLDNMSAQEKFDNLKQVLTDPTYDGGTYERMMKDISKKYEQFGIANISSKQLQTVTSHLRIHSDLWY